MFLNLATVLALTLAIVLTPLTLATVLDPNHSHCLTLTLATAWL